MNNQSTLKPITLYVEPQLYKKYQIQAQDDGCLTPLRRRYNTNQLFNKSSSVTTLNVALSFIFFSTLLVTPFFEKIM